MINDYKTAISNIREQFEAYLIKYNLKSVVIGQSGGIDSALTTVLAKPVCDKLGIKILSRSITIVTNKADEKERARNIGLNFAHEHKDIDLSDAFMPFASTLMEDFETSDKTTTLFKLRQGNVKARMRMMYLYDLAQTNRGMVLSTDNYTELMLGFWTLHGDVGDYGMIQNLWKTEVYAMARYLAAENSNTDAANALLACVNALATDGLGISTGDLDQIGAASYEEVDQILIAHQNNTNFNKTQAYQNVVQRKQNSEYKRINPYNIPRNLISDIEL